MRRPLLAATLALGAGGPLAAQRPAVAQTPRSYSAPAGAPYTAEAVTVRTPMGHTLAGTLTLPKGTSRAHPVAAVVTISGSGPQDRDEDVGIDPSNPMKGYRPFRQYADSLARRGIAVLRMDDRGVGGSTGDFATGTSADFAQDIRAGLAYLRTRADIDARRLALLGHSEGGIIAPMVALEEPELAAIVLLAGPSLGARPILQFQLTSLIKHDTALRGPRLDSALATIPATIDSLQRNSAWMRFFMDYDPLATARKVRTPVLILNGANDLQCTPDQAPQLAEAFVKAGNHDVTMRVFPGLNHLFLLDPDGSPMGYAKLDPTVGRDVVGVIADWLAERLRKH